MVTLRMFASVREAAGQPSGEFESSHVAELLGQASIRYGPEFAKLLQFCTIAVNGMGIDDEGLGTVLGASDEVALLPPVSGG